MSYRKLLTAVIAVLTMLPCLVFADNTVLSGDFDGSESTIAGMPGSRCTAEQLAYQVIEQVQVSASGDFTVVDAFDLNFDNGVDLVIYIYQGSFDPGSPLSNLVTPGGIDHFDNVSLVAATNYTVVVQHWCSNREGAWAVTFSGPGDLASGSVVVVPEWTEGSFIEGDPTTNSSCGNSRYQASGPIQVPASGTYYYSDISTHFDVDMCLQIFSAPFDPANPTANRLGWFRDRGTFELQANTDYYFVAQPEVASDTGEFFYIFAPPAPFRIQHAMAGNWFDPPTSGQGFFMDVYDSFNLMFVGWYTYDLERPADDVTAQMGDPGHRWLTALGSFTGNKAVLDIAWASGMIFDSATPPKQVSEKDGTLTVEFFDCWFGEVTYDIWSVGVTGTIPIRRIVNDVVPLCESLTDGPGQPGPLTP